MGKISGHAERDESGHPIILGAGERDWRPLDRGIAYAPSRMRCPTCSSPAKRIVGLPGQHYVCTKCGLEFEPNFRPPQEAKKKFNQNAQTVAEDYVIASIQPGEKYDLTKLQGKVETFKRAYRPEDEEPEVPKIAPEPKGDMYLGAQNPKMRKFDMKGMMSHAIVDSANQTWTWEYPAYREPDAQNVYLSLDEKLFDITVEVVGRPVKGGGEQEIIRVVAKRRPAILATDEMAKKLNREIAVLPDARFCIKDYTTYPAGTKVFFGIRSGGLTKDPKEYLCPICGNPLRRPYEQMYKSKIWKDGAGVYKPTPIVRQPPSTPEPAPTPSLAGTVAPTPQPTTKNVLTLDGSYRCHRCKTMYKAGDKALLIGGLGYCPKCGGFLEKVT